MTSGLPHSGPPFQYGYRLILTLAAGLLGTTALSAAEMQNSDCLDCHSDKTMTATNAAGRAISLFVDPAALAASVHRTNSCASCHNDITDKHPDDHLAPRAVDCARCHLEPSLSYAASVHGVAHRDGTDLRDRIRRRFAPTATARTEC